MQTYERQSLPRHSLGDALYHACVAKYHRPSIGWAVDARLASATMLLGKRDPLLQRTPRSTPLSRSATRFGRSEATRGQGAASRGPPAPPPRSRPFRSHSSRSHSSRYLDLSSGAAHGPAAPLVDISRHGQANGHGRAKSSNSTAVSGKSPGSRLSPVTSEAPSRCASATHSQS